METKETGEPEVQPDESTKDAPVDLSKRDELIVTLDGAWRVLHDAGVA